MKTTTATFKQILASKGARTYLIKIDLELASGTTLHLTGADIWEDSFSIDTASSGTSSLDIGTAVIGQCKFTLNNIEGDFDDYDFFNADATVWLGLKGDEVSGQQQYYRMGFFTVDEPQTANGLISLTLLDNMWLFDRPFSEAGVTFTSQTTARSIVLTMCTHFGVTLATQNFHGYDFPITQAPEEIDEMNCREVLQYIAMIGCNFCFIDDTGALNIKWYNTSATSAQTVNFDLNQSTQFGTDDITVTGVKFVIDDTEYTIGTSGYRLELENPFVNVGNVNSVLNLIWDILNGFTFRIFNITTASDLSAEIGDKVRIKDYKGNYIYSYITLNSFKLAAHLLQCNAQAPRRTLVKRYSKQVKAVVEVARQQATELISAYDQSVQRLNNLVEQSMGAFKNYDEAPTGGRIYYLSNMPITKDPQTGACVFEQGSVVFRMAGDVFSVSQDGGQTWVNGYDPITGELVVNVLNAIGINAEWVRTGTLTVGGATSGTQYPTIEVYDANDNLIVEINRNGITMHAGIISSPDYAEAIGARYATTGMKIDVINKILRSPYFAIDTNGAYFKGEIEITGDIELGRNSFKFAPADYYIAADFDLTCKAADGYVGSSSYTLLKHTFSFNVQTNEWEEDSGSPYTIATRTLTDDTPILITHLDHTTGQNGHDYFEVRVTSSSTITTSIYDAVLAKVDETGFHGVMDGWFKGRLESDAGILNGFAYGYGGHGHFEDEDGFEFNMRSGFMRPNGAALFTWDGGGVVYGYEQSGGSHAGEGATFQVINPTHNNGNSGIVLYDPDSGEPGIYRLVPTSSSQAAIEEALWDNGTVYMKADVIKSTSDSPPTPLEDGQIFLVYEN